MQKRFRFIFTTIILFVVFLLVGCNNSPVSFEINFDSNGGSLVESVTYDGINMITIPDNPTKESFAFDGWFWDNGTFEIPFTANSLLDTPLEGDLTVYAKWVEQDDELTTQLKSIYLLAVQVNAFQGTYEEWLETVRGPQGVPGEDGKSSVLRVNDGVLEWQLQGDTTWIGLFDLSTLAGSDGKDGKNIVLQVAEGYIQWQYTGDTTWTNLVSLATLTGADGTNGTDGTDGIDGREVLFQVAEGYIQWQYTGDTTWTNLVSLAILAGADGTNGTDGIDGREVLFQVAEGYIQWQSAGDAVWMSLVDLETLSGTDGLTPYIGENGNWWVGETDTGIPSQDEYTIDEYNHDLQSTIERITESVVTVIVVDESDNEISHGSGVIYEYDDMGFYRVITNEHVIDGANKVKILSYDNIYYEAEVYAVHETMDIALLRFETTDVYQYSTPKYVDITPYETVISIGTPISLDFNNTVTMGLISKTDYNPDGNQNMIIHSSYVYLGNSGGPLFNTKGELIGINTYIWEFNGNQVSSLNFAININELIEWIQPSYKITFVQNYTFDGTLSVNPTEFSILWYTNQPFSRYTSGPYQNNPIFTRGIFGGDLIDGIYFNIDNIFLSIDGIQPDFDKYEQGVTFLSEDVTFNIEWAYYGDIRPIYIVYPGESEPAFWYVYGIKTYLPNTANQYTIGDTINPFHPMDIEDSNFEASAYFAWDPEGNEPVLFPFEGPSSGMTWYIIESGNVTVVSDEEGISYEILNGSATITEYSGSETSLIIDETVNVNGVEYPITSIGEKAFQDNNTLISITLPRSLQNIRSSAFANCVNLETVNFGQDSQLEYIYDRAFAGCTHLVTFVFPNSLKYIDEFAFSGTGFEHIQIPDNVEHISDKAFSGFNKLVSITVDDNNPYYASVDGVLYNKDLTVLIIYPFEKPETSFVFPESVNKINDNTFFSDNLIDLYVNSDLLEFDLYVFNYCHSLQNIFVHENNPYFDSVDGVLYNQDRTYIILFPWNKQVGRNLSIPNGVKVIDKQSFRGSSLFPEVIYIPESVSYIDVDIFEGLEGLRNIIVDENNPYFSSIDGVLFNKDQTILLCYPAGKTETLYTIPNTVIKIAEHSFWSTSPVHIFIPDSVQFIENMAFWSNKTILTSEKSKPNNWSSTMFFDESNFIIWGYQETKSSNGVQYALSNDNFAYVIGSDIISSSVIFIEDYIDDHKVIGITSGSFWDNINIYKIVIPDSVISIGAFAFTGANNISIFAEASFQPIGWVEGWNGNMYRGDFPVYWFGDWTIDDLGVPQPNN